MKVHANKISDWISFLSKKNINIPLKMANKFEAKKKIVMKIEKK